MNAWSKILLGLGALLLSACGGRGEPSSGLDKATLLVDLELDKTDQLCTWAIEVTDGLICEDGDKLEAFTAYDCTEKYAHLPAGCQATVGHFEQCILLLRECGEDADQVLAACSPLITCTAED